MGITSFKKGVSEGQKEVEDAAWSATIAVARWTLDRVAQGKPLTENERVEVELEVAAVQLQVCALDQILGGGLARDPGRGDEDAETGEHRLDPVQTAAAGSLAWVTLEAVKFGKPSALGIATGMVAGLGTITPASGFVGPGGALLIGLAAGVICFYMVLVVKQKWRIDDSLDVFPVHGIGGVLGTLLAGVFSATSLGVFSGYGFADGISSMGGQLYVQLIGVLATVVFTAVVTYVILKIVGAVTGLRVTEDQETEGLDIALLHSTLSA